MNHAADGGCVRLRAALLWTAVTALALGVGRVALAEVARPVTTPHPDFASLLVRGCAALALVALSALWLLTTDVVRQVLLTGRRARTLRGRPGPLRTLLLAACGVAVLSGTTTAAFAGDGPDAPLSAEVLDGLPLPDRASGDEPDTASRSTVVRVRSGDSLWTIAARSLDPDASAADVASYSRRIHATNTAVIGPDPDLIRPDQRLRLPPR